MLDSILHTIKKFIPRQIFSFFQPAYHYALALLAACIYHFPARRMHVVAITGTKGKTTTAELLHAIWCKQGYKAALSNTIHFVINGDETRNTTKMALPGRFFLQRFLRKAANAGCTHVVVEVSSEAARQFRHRFVAWDGLIFTNLTPEHIESHGSFDAYKKAKLSIAQYVAHSPKAKTTLVANRDDSASSAFAAFPFSKTQMFSLSDAKQLTQTGRGSTFLFNNEQFTLYIPGTFNVANALAAATYAQAQNIPLDTIRDGLALTHGIRGRMEFVDEGQPFDVVVDYAHTKESLEYVYTSFADKRRICVLGNTGGGRDTWKRPAMAKIADTHCDHIVLTDEDPYDEDPRSIAEEMREAIQNTKTQIIMDRREAIKTAISLARPDDVVLITGKGTDPYIMRADNKKEPWDDSAITREILQEFTSSK